MLVPKLRFKREDGTEYPEWNVIDFWNAVSINGSLVDPRLPEYQNMLHIGTANIEKNTGRLLDCKTALEEGITSGKYLFDETCVVYSKIRPELNKATYPKFRGLCSADAYPLKPNNGILPEIILSQLLGHKFYKYVTSTSARTKMPKVNQEELSGYSFAIPCLEEQQKIADFLSTVDEVITQSEAEVQNLEQQKKAAMQKIFSQEVRFKREDGSEYPEWEDVEFGSMIEEYRDKTSVENEDVLLSSAINGMFLNTELFGHQRGKSNIGYLKIDYGTLILSAQNLHLGNANVNLRFEHGIISPAYKTYHIKNCNLFFMAQWIKREETNQFFYDATTVGASQCRRNVDWNGLYEQTILIPCEEEQQKIADFLSAYDEAISYTKQELEHWKQLKKGLLQQMFV